MDGKKMGAIFKCETCAKARSEQAHPVEEQVQLLEAAEILPPHLPTPASPSHIAHNGLPPTHNHETISASHKRYRHLFFRHYVNEMGWWTTAATRAQATTAQNLTQLYLPLDLSLLLGGLVILVNPSLRQRSSALGLGHQANSVPHPATSSCFDNPISRLFIGRTA
ncbi:hypothetical protein M422DRAFT_264029 [Sphaerobolus stellatus SS14]|uniref:Uncharacterized protein n=1 Tax=Sphaerobolus stellatus (strain SS14) TaxID=990650 RepID=A0A0C9UX98_SPHS4|nr:hypothetical protein M422DRAFT_264029 [Sphaerobolus stellatus SS14]